MEVTLYRVGTWFNKEGGTIRITRSIFKDTGKNFVGNGRRIPKDKILKVDTMFAERHTVISYHTYCYENQQEAAIKMLKNHVGFKINQYKEEIDQLWHINRNQEFKIKVILDESTS